MASIVTITLNPAIDKSTSVAAMVPEKKMKCAIPVFEPGGGGINVARAIRKMGGDALALYLAGGHTGTFFRQLLDRENVRNVMVEIDSYTRENLIVYDNAANLQYRFGMPGPTIRENEWKQLLSCVEGLNEVDFIVASGSIPSGVPEDIFAKIAAIARKKNAKCIIDTSGPALKLAVAEGVFLLKPNLGELSSLVGKEELNIEMVNDVAKGLVQNGHCEVVIVSMGPSGAMLITKNDIKQFLAPAIKRKSTVGAGDSMVAGIVLSLAKGMPVTDAARYGVACGTAATLNKGTELCRLEDVNRLLPLIRIT